MITIFLRIVTYVLLFLSILFIGFLRLNFILFAILVLVDVFIVICVMENINRFLYVFLHKKRNDNNE
jgi:hypothetical protein